jgi:hypothetical protein
MHEHYNSNSLEILSFFYPNSNPYKSPNVQEKHWVEYPFSKSRNECLHIKIENPFG